MAIADSSISDVFLFDFSLFTLSSVFLPGRSGFCDSPGRIDLECESA